MKYKIIFLLLMLIGASLSLKVNAQDRFKDTGDTALIRSYQKEISFLKSYKREIQKKLENLKRQTEKNLKEGELEVARLESSWLLTQSRSESLALKLSTMDRETENLDDKKDQLHRILEQAAVDTSSSVQPIDKISLAFESSFAELKQLSSVTTVDGSFFTEKGEKVSGQVLMYGGVARYGLSGSSAGVLYPVGGGDFKIWNSLSRSKISSIESMSYKSLPLFIYENAKVGFKLSEGKSFIETVKAGGAVAWLLVAMGILVAVLVVLRFFILRQAQGKDSEYFPEVMASVACGDFSRAIKRASSEKGAVAMVVKNTLSVFERKQPEQLDDVIAETILSESRETDKYATVITIVASVATLLGLLGTVTGMINTFEMITEYGNTNPKMLSGGISEALITTKYGLVVGIPALLFGHLLSAWNESIKSRMEEVALKICNQVVNKG